MLREGAYLSQLIWSCPPSHNTLLCLLYLPLFQELCVREKTEFEYMGETNSYWSRTAGLSGSTAAVQGEMGGEKAV